MAIQSKVSEQYFLAVLFVMPYLVVSTFECVDEIPNVRPFNRKLLSRVQGGSNFRVSE